MKNKNNKNSLKVGVLPLASILIVIISLTIINRKFNFLDNSLFEESIEKQELSSNLEEIRTGLSIITILTCIDKYNAGGDYVTKKNKNLLETTSARQMFVMEEILTNTENNKNFILLDTEGREIDDSNYPTEEGIYAYYPKDLFIEEYQKYFKDSFDIEDREKSTIAGKYDTNKDYIYYNNRRAGLNGLMIEKITISSVNKKNSDEYQANIILNYSERLAEMLEVDNEKATINYTKDNNRIKIISYELK